MYFPVVAVDDGPCPSRHLQEYVPLKKKTQEVAIAIANVQRRQNKRVQPTHFFPRAKKGLSNSYQVTTASKRIFGFPLDVCLLDVFYSIQAALPKCTFPGPQAQRSCNSSRFSFSENGETLGEEGETSSVCLLYLSRLGIKASAVILNSDLSLPRIGAQQSSNSSHFFSILKRGKKYVSQSQLA